MRKLGKPHRAEGGSRSKPRQQRCAVRITYLNNRTRGQWKAHGRYLARETATTGKGNEVGFNRDRSGIDIASELGRWQSSGDPRLWKIILSPEFGDRVDLERLTRQLVDRMAVDLGTDLEWIAVAHHNTEHPHVHMVVRGIGSDGQPFQLRREYLKYGIREAAEDLCTRQIGYRTRDDATEAERREIGEHRFTSLDRAILRGANPPARGPDTAELTNVRTPNAGPHDEHVVARLAVLQRMGLAEAAGANLWRVRRDLEEVLRAMQHAADRQKTLAAYGVPISDDRLPIEVLDLQTFTAVEGRILVHGQDEQKGRNHLMLEGIDSKVHFIEYTPEMELLRAEGGLRANSYLRLRRMFANGRSIVQVQDLGDAEKVLKNRALLGGNARALVKRGITPTEDGWGGWLGRYQSALAATAAEIMNTCLPARSRGRGRSLSRER
jgi:type IV secretory pathway VirD2 relaxase